MNSKDQSLHQLCLLILFLHILVSELPAQGTPFTVLTPSGVNIREEPSQTSKKMAAIPFGTVIMAQGNYDDIYSLHLRDSIEINGTRGHWLPVEHGGIKGFVFSAYVLMGEWIRKPPATGTGYRILTAGDHCDAIDYAPGLHWYMFSKIENGYVFRKVNVSIRLMHSYTEAEKMSGDWSIFPLKVLVNDRDTNCFLLGMKQPLTDTLQASIRKFYDPSYAFDFDRGMFFYPEQFYDFYLPQNSFQVGAREEIYKDSSAPGGFRREYKLAYRLMFSRLDFKEYDIDIELSSGSPAQRHAMYRTPTLVWAGDLNGDNLLDIIVHFSQMTDTCGESWYKLFFSDPDPDVLLRNIVTFGDSHCGGC